MMTEIIAYCGLDCGKCRAYLATKENDSNLAADVAQLWSNEIEGIYTIEDIWCDGCHSDKLHGFCASCPVRICAKGKMIGNCGACNGYPCDKLDALYEQWVESSPIEAKANLERLRATQV